MGRQHYFFEEEYGSSLLITHYGVDPDSFQGSRWALSSLKYITMANAVLVAENFYGLRLRVEKCRMRNIEETPLFSTLKETFPSLAVKLMACKAEGTDKMTTRKYLVFTDDRDAVHFRLMYS
jgi:hypothetical protein